MEKAFLTYQSNVPQTDTVVTKLVNETPHEIINLNLCGLMAVCKTNADELADTENIGYNRFDMHKFTEALNKVGYEDDFYFGREYSVVAYIPFTRELFEALNKFMVKLKVDEYDVEVADDGKYYIRMWWD